jgi:trehalose 2-sulfotransferase
MLTRALWRTGLAGAPEEYFTPDYVGDFMARFPGELRGTHSADIHVYLQTLFRLRTSPNGAFGVKLHAGHLDSPILRGHDLQKLLHEPKYLWIRRKDRVRQAISYALAEQTGVWILDGNWLAQKQPRTKAPEYRHRDILHYLSIINGEEEIWRRYFAEHNVRPHIVVYEDLCESYEESLKRCLAELGVPVPASLPVPGIRRQADSLNDRWRERFMSESESSL